jgi:hypothetical protein
MLAVFFSTLLRAADPLTTRDTEEIRTVSSAFAKAMNTTEVSEYPKYLDSASLEKLAGEYRRWIAWMVEHKPKDMPKVFILSPSAQALLSEKDPVKFFSGFAFSPTTRRIADDLGMELKIVAVTGRGDVAYVVMEGRFDGSAGTTRPHASGWRMIRTSDGWKVDGSQMVRLVRRLIERMKTELSGSLKGG